MSVELPPALASAAARDAERLAAALGEAGRALLEQRRRDPGFAARLARVLACSRFFLLESERCPELFIELLASGDLEREPGPGEYRAWLARELPLDADEARLMELLRRLRRREMLGIVWRDLNRIADLEGTTRALSWLADSTLEAALAHAHAALVERHGEPRAADGSAQRLVVLGMGKLGALELNLSSDIDLIFAYPEQGETDGERPLSNHEFFTRLGQRLIKAIDTNTRDGFVFRVDMRLRPYGDSGALALNFDALEEYYQNQGRDWERYAMIKARVVAGDAAAGARLLEMLRPFTYRRYIDFGAIDALRDMKAMIRREVQRRGRNADVKIGAGGIREIEFIAQSFQLIRGGRETELQERSLLRVLELLVAGEHLPAAVAAELREAYVFLRNTEHALQAWADQQTQTLPEDGEGRARLALALGFADWETFHGELERHRANVSRHFRDVVSAGQEPAGGAQPGAATRALWAMDKEPERLLERLAALGFEDPADTLQRIARLRESNRLRNLQSAGRERLDRFMPLLLESAAGTAHPSAVIARTMPLVESVLRRSAYLVLLEENPGALEQLVKLCSASPWIAQELANHPVLLDELIDPRTLYVQPDRAWLRDELQQQVLRIPWSDLEAQMEALRYYKLVHGLRCAASEVSGALPLMKVSDYLSFQAEALLAQVLSVAWHNLVERHGVPQKAPGVPCDPGFAIIAYGKLGGIELGHGSDLDLVFLHDADPALATDGERSIENSVFFTRLGQRIIHVLTTFTPLGQLYEVDMRLRPSGAAGLLVSSLAAFREYQFRQAWTWEHQALVRARPVAGCAVLGRQFEELRREVLALERERGRLAAEVCEMREKMRAHLLDADTRGGKSPRFHLKQGAGGIVDIEFMVQYCVLAWSREYPALSVYTDNIRILEALSASGLIPGEDAQLLTDAYKAYRTTVHKLTLQQQGEIVDSTGFQDLRDAVCRVWERLLGADCDAPAA